MSVANICAISLTLMGKFPHFHELSRDLGFNNREGNFQAIMAAETGLKNHYL
jgi:hypothetical protein